MEHPSPYPCEACGGASQWCFFGRTLNPDKVSTTFFISTSPLEMNTQRRNYYINLLSPHVDQESIFFTSLVKCNDKASSQKSNAACKSWLAWEIKKEKPALVITSDAKSYTAITGRDDVVEGVGNVTLMKLGEHTFFHLHLDDLWEIRKLPEREYFQNWAVQKIPAILRGDYPRRPAEGKDYRYLTSLADVKAWCDEFQHQGDIIALDTEGGGKDAEGRGVGVDMFRPESYIISLQGTIVPGHSIFYDDTHGDIATRKYLLDFCMTKWHVFHNATFDYKFIREKWGLNMWERFHFDTMIADHTLREWDRKRNLKRLADLFLPEFEDYEEPLQRWFHENKIPKVKWDYADLPRQMLFEYGSMDPDVTLRLFHLQCQWLQESNLWDVYMNHVRKTIRVYGDDMNPGWGVSLPMHQQLTAEFTKSRHEALAEIKNLSYWQQWKGHREVDLKATGLRFWDEETQCCYEDSQMYEAIPPKDPDNPKRNFYWPPSDDKPGRRVKKWTYTKEQLEPDPSNRAFKCDLLYGEKYLGLAVQHLTDKKEPAVHEVALIYLKRNNPSNLDVTTLVDNFSKLDKSNKFIGTFLKPAFDHHDAQGKFKFGWLRKGDECAHPDYMLGGGEGIGGEGIEGGTNSGRPSAKNPNQLNIPSRDKNGKRIKKMYIPVARDQNLKKVITTEQWYLLNLDYSQVELRVLADESDDPFMVHAYLNNQDLHTRLACERFGHDLEWFEERLKNFHHPEYQIAYEMRAAAKTSWFAFIYGAGVWKLIETLAKQGVWFSVKEMKILIDGLRAMLPQVAQLKSRVLMNAPVCTTKFGRRRVVQNIRSSDEWIRGKAGRQLFNFLIQSTAADICSRGMYLSAEWLREQRKLHGLRSYPMGNVYDSFILAVPANELDYIASNIQRIMESPDLPWKPIVPLKVDVEFGPTWGDLEPWKASA